MIPNGYVRAANNIHSLPGILVTPCGAGVPRFPLDCEVQVLSDRIRVFRNKFFGQSYSKISFWDQETVAVFDSKDDYLKACPEVSKGGINHITGPNVFD